MTTKAKAAKAQLAVDEFNAYHPVGALVECWSGSIGPPGSGKLGRVSALASLLGGHTPIAWVDGRSVGLTHVKPKSEIADVAKLAQLAVWVRDLVALREPCKLHENETIKRIVGDVHLTCVFDDLIQRNLIKAGAVDLS